MDSIETAVITMPATEEAQRAVDRLLLDKKEIRVIEAGCGTTARLKLAADSKITGIDVSQIQLERNPRLNERILGDVQSYPLEKGKYDLAICWDVLEHLPRPQDALKNLAGALKPGGVLVLAMPNVGSIKGLVTKFTPHAFHVWVYRNFFEIKEAGLPGNRPFKTFLRWSIAPSRIKKFARENNLAVEYAVTYEFQMQKNFRKKFFLIDWLFGLAGILSKVLSLGRADLNHTDCIFVLRQL